MSLGPAQQPRGNVALKMKTFDEGAAEALAIWAARPGGGAVAPVRFLRQLRRGAFYWPMACWARIKPAR